MLQRDGSFVITREPSLFYRISSWTQWGLAPCDTDAYLELHPDKKKDLRRIEGFVKDEKGQPLPHAWASISGWSGGAPTDDKGHFVFWTPHKDNTLDVYCDDYHPALKVEIDTQPISISLKHH